MAGYEERMNPPQSTHHKADDPRWGDSTAVFPDRCPLDPGYQPYLITAAVIFPDHSDRPRITLSRQQGMKIVMSIWAKNPVPGRARFSTLPLLFLSLLPTLPFAQVPTSDIREVAAAGDPQAQFALANYCFRNRYVTLDYSQFLSCCRKSAAQGFVSGAESARQHV